MKVTGKEFFAGNRHCCLDANKPPRLIIIKIAFIIMSIGICAAVFLLRVFGINPQIVLYGVSIQNKRPAVNIENVMSGQFQADFDTWFSETFPLRSYLVRGYDQLMYVSGSMINDVQSGVGGDLHGELWMDGYLTYQIDESALNSYENNLSIIKNFTDSHNIAFLYMITPNKAEVYADTLPWNYRIMDAQLEKKAVAKEQILDILKKHKIAYLDTTGLMLDLRRNGLCEPFPKTGIHWNRYGATCALQSYIDALNQLGQEIPAILPEYVMTDTPDLSDTDYKELLNVYWTRIDKMYPHVKFVLEQGADKIDKSVYVMGTSYHNAFIELFKENDMPFLHYKRLFYNQKWTESWRTDKGVAGGEWNSGIPMDEVDYGEVLANDILVIEHNAGELPLAHIDFVNRLADYIERNSEQGRGAE